MRRTILLLTNLILVTGVCLVKAQTTQPEPATNQKERSDEATLLDRAPDSVKEQVMRHASAQQLQEITAYDWNGSTIYEAVFEGEQVNTRLRLAENGAPISMHIVRTGDRIVEAAGARRDDPAPQPQPTSPTTVPDSVKNKMQEQLGEVPIVEVQPKVFYQLTIRQNGDVQQVWADEEGTLLQAQQQQQEQQQP